MRGSSATDQLAETGFKLSVGSGIDVWYRNPVDHSELSVSNIPPTGSPKCRLGYDPLVNRLSVPRRSGRAGKAKRKWSWQGGIKGKSARSVPISSLVCDFLFLTERRAKLDALLAEF